ncbi:hypothetical protein [Herpetosiphon giganteus]|uniref:hypothetical protein n=1 Tax=Herpetosiphon giganteus TaxID=2029754 RepID=UPI00195DF0D6|nr:hypothetical protein [Herpetosiphon giganteus]MBM7846663.1 hypothetical protein [Herpetosiphon giganteus]
MTIIKQQSLSQINRIKSDISKVLIIHYSCESFYDRPAGYSPRISSIAIKNFSSRQTHSFSIHRIAEFEKVSKDEIEEHYDTLERKMLDEFFIFIKNNKENIYVHWNMRDENYGFQAIYRRYKFLGGKPIIISENQLIDLSHTLINIYGSDYIGHPRIEKLIEKNKISKKNFLTGQQEADAFKDKEYNKLHLSTLYKVDLFANILVKYFEGKLKTNNSSLLFKAKELRETPIFQVLEIIAAIGGVVGFIILIINWLF